MQKLFNHNFARMLFSGNHNNKAVSAMMLVMLLFIHSVKLLHSHSYHPLSSNSDCKAEKSIVASIEKTSADCGICSYHLSKDADEVRSTELPEQKFAKSIFASQIISFQQSSFLSAFESRGPPAFI